MTLPLSKSSNIRTHAEVLELDEFKQLDALLIHYAQLADMASYKRVSSEVQKLKHDTACAVSKGSDLELLRATLVQEVYDLAWAICDYPTQA